MCIVYVNYVYLVDIFLLYVSFFSLYYGFVFGNIIDFSCFKCFKFGDCLLCVI